MSELDLVPVRFHRRRLVRVWLLRAVAVCALIATLIVGLRSFLEFRIASYGLEIDSLHVAHEQAEQERRVLSNLNAESKTLEQRLGVLDGLRGGVAAIDMFRVVDESLDENLWFRKWNFRRAGEIIDRAPSAVETGYFIVLPQEGPSGSDRTWRIQTHMEITAEAKDHASLARFVRRLSDRPEIESARILSTHTRKDVDTDLVEFELAVVVRVAQ